MKYIHLIKDNKYLISALICVLAVTLTIYFQDPLKSKYPNATTQLISYKSLNLYDFVNITDGDGLTVYGHFILPYVCTEDNKCPLMIYSHGSAAWREHHERYIHKLVDEGIAVFKLFPFGSRGVESTVGNQTQVTHQMIISDAYGILPVLEKDYNNIDYNRLGFMGTSLGGGAALYSAWNPTILKSIYNSDKEFKLHIALYPPCFIYPEENVWTNNTLVIMIGSADQWTKADACTELMGQIYSGKTYNTLNKKLYLYDNEHHSFDDIHFIKELKGTLDFTNCRFYMEPSGKTYFKEGNNITHVGSVENRLYALSKCAIRKDNPVGYHSKLLNSHAMENFIVEVICGLKPNKLYE